MRRVLLFSGGYDSTCLLADLVEEASNDGSEVCCVTIQHNLTGAEKLRRESLAQEAILNYLTNKYPKVHLTHEVIQVQSNWNVGSTFENAGLCQPIFWAANLVPLLNSEDKIYFGYSKSDDAISVKPYIVDMIKAACAIQDCKKIEVKFPYEFHSKEDILEHLFMHNNELVDMCTSCEGLHNGLYVCGKCVPCEHLKTALVSIVVSNKFNNDVKKKARKLLIKLFQIVLRVEDRNLVEGI